jgi:hypothetical protein
METEMITDSNEAVTPNAKLRETAAAAGCRMKDLLVLAPQNDPFNSGTAADRKNATWFYQMFRRFGGPGTHLRKIHYRIISAEEPVLKPDGERYLNTEGCWKYLGTASKHARYLGLVSPQDLLDQRNPDPHLYAPDPCDPPGPQWAIDEFYGFTIPTIWTRLSVDVDLPEITVTGYDYNPGEQPYYLELWLEKSTQNSELIPLCEQYGINLVTAAGFQSITGAVQCLSRVPQAAQLKRPARVFYISDYDPAGLQMPVAVSRQFEFWMETFGIKADLKLTPIALTKDQVATYNLPRVPVKDEDLRKASFEAIHGEGAVELDAMEALYPGLLTGIVEQEVLQYRDVDLRGRLSSAGYEAEQEADEAWTVFLGDIQERAEDIRERADAVTATFMPEILEVKERYDAAM